MESVTRVLTLDEAVCITLYANAFWKGMDLFFSLNPGYEEILGQTRPGVEIGLGEEKLCTQTAQKLTLCRISAGWIHAESETIEHF